MTRLTALELAGAVSLPPDWAQLEQLQSLVVHNSRTWGIEAQQERDGRPWGGFTWGSAQLTALSALTSVRFAAYNPILPGERGPMLRHSACIAAAACAWPGASQRWRRSPRS